MANTKLGFKLKNYLNKMLGQEGETSNPNKNDIITITIAQLVNKIAAAVRKFDTNRYSIENYMFFGWEDLFDIGKNRGLIKRFEYDYYRDLSKIPLNDNYKNPCD